MNWETLISTYPSEKESILKIKSLRESIMKYLAEITVPTLHDSWLDKGYAQFAKTLSPVCTRTWKDFFGEEPGFSMEDILNASAQGEPVAEMEGVDTDALEVIVNDSFSLLFNRLREANPALIPETWDKGFCPFCGDTPRIAFDSETGRLLFCPTCGHSWRFRRFQCPVCGNADHTTLGYFEAEGIKSSRVYFCRLCNSYLKVIDQKQRITEDAETEDTLSLELDRLAQEEGFSRA